MRKVDNTDSLTYDSVMKMTPFVPAKSKVEAVARLYAAAQAPAEPLGPGGEEKKSVLTRTAERLALPVDDAAPKDVLARQILEELGKTWDSSFSSAGQTITLAGLNAILFVTEAELRLRATRKLRSEPPIFPSWFTPARNKLEAVRRLSSVTGGRPQDLGPGSKERKSVLIDLVTNLGLPLDTRLSKTRLAGAVAAMLGMPWTEACWSTGETITLEGLNAVLAGAEQRALRGPHGARYRIRQEARLLVTALGGSCPVHWDGRTCVKEMIANEYSKARQTEWVGWYFEFVGLPALVNAYGGGPVRVGVTEFDYAREFVWDLKTHAQKGLNSSCEVSGDTPLNDRESVLRCIEERGSLGFLVLSGSPSFDGSAEFDAWHRKMRGKAAASTSKRPRRLKVALKPLTIQAYTFHGMQETERALANGVLKTFQQGHQPDGRSRRPKFILSLDKAQEAGLVIAQYDFGAPMATDQRPSK